LASGHIEVDAAAHGANAPRAASLSAGGVPTFTPQPTDRGVETSGLAVGVDWLAFTFPNTTRDRVVEFLTQRLAGDFVDLPRGRYGYEHQAVGPQGALVLSSGRRRDVHVSLPGKWCRSIDEPSMRFVLLYASLRANITRCDLAADDWGKRITPTDVYDAMERREGVTHCRDWSLYVNNKGGRTAQIGAASSLQSSRSTTRASSRVGPLTRSGGS